MISPNPDQMRNEMASLLELQLSALEKEAACGTTTAEVLLYERRQKRISELCTQLLAPHASSA
jgi:hypothetical protein